MCLGIPGQIIGIIDAKKMLANVNIAGVKRAVNIACVIEDREPIDACIGLWVLVHVGFAMSRIDEQEAHQTLKLLSELAEFHEEMDAIKNTDA